MTTPLPPEHAAAVAAAASRLGRFARRILFYPEIGSTNDVAARLAAAGAEDGTVVLAAAQSAGRGRRGTDWFSPPDAGLYVSVLLVDRGLDRGQTPVTARRGDLTPPAGTPVVITLAAGVALAEGIRAATGLPVEIKWPNDIVAPGAAAGRGRKLAGILAEAVAGADGIEHVVLGFGINVRPAPCPASLAGRAVSLEEELGRRVDAALVLVECLAALAARIDDLRARRIASVLERWRALAPSSTGARVEWRTADGLRRGTTQGLAEDGALLVRAGPGVERVIAGAVRWLP